MASYNHITVDSLISGLNDMLSLHASPENIETPQKNKSVCLESFLTENVQSDNVSNSVMVIY